MVINNSSQIKGHIMNYTKMQKPTFSKILEYYSIVLVYFYK